MARFIGMARTCYSHDLLPRKSIGNEQDTISEKQIPGILKESGTEWRWGELFRFTGSHGRVSPLEELKFGGMELDRGNVVAGVGEGLLGV